MPNKHSIKSRMRIEIKDISPEGLFEGWLSPYGNIDGGNDLVEPGAFSKTLKDAGNKRPLLWQHKTDMPIGELTLEERKEGLWASGKLLLDLPEAQKAYLLIKARIVKGLSIGFETIKDSVEAGVRRLKEIKLYEGSIVTFPMNEMALISSVKGNVESKADFNETLATQQLADAYYQMRGALMDALGSCLYSGMSKDEVISTSETCIQQFSEAYMSFLPEYLAMMEEYWGPLETWAKEGIEKKQLHRHLESKSGKKISSANASVITTACESLLALLESEAEGDSTSGGEKAATESEPVESHSATGQDTIDAEMKAMLQQIEDALKK
jgi:HK97 family phage prohead protease